MEFLLRKAGYLPSREEFKRTLEEYSALFYAFEPYIQDEEWKIYLQALVKTPWETPLQILEYVQENPLPKNAFVLPNVVVVNSHGILHSTECQKKLNEFIAKTQ